jgi:hypothetical protein
MKDFMQIAAREGRDTCRHVPLTEATRRLAMRR